MNQQKEKKEAERSKSIASKFSLIAILGIISLTLGFILTLNAKKSNVLASGYVIEMEESVPTPTPVPNDGTTRQDTLFYVQIDPQILEHIRRMREPHVDVQDITFNSSTAVNQPSGISKEDFVAGMENMPYDYVGYFGRNAEHIWDYCHEYGVNEYFVCGIIALESGWGRHPSARNNYFGYTSSRGFKKFDSEEEGIQSLCSLLSSDKYFGRFDSDSTITASNIAGIYCPGSTSWSPIVVDCGKRVLRSMQ